MFDKLRAKISKRRKPPKAPCRLVPEGDYELLKVIRIANAHGDSVEMPSPQSYCKEDQLNQVLYANAKILYLYYGLTVNEVIEETGVYIEMGK